MDFMDQQAVGIVTSIAERQLAKAGNTSAEQKFEVFITWKAKILQNWKYILSTSAPGSGTFYELTYNGANDEWYVDIYKKDNSAVLDWATSRDAIAENLATIQPGLSQTQRNPTEENKYGHGVYARAENAGGIPCVQNVKPPKEQQSRVERMFGKRESWSGQEAKSGNEEPGKPSYHAGYKGFLLIRCPECGETRSFFAKDYIEETRCPCGCRIRLENLIPAHVTCSKCGNYIKYRTNIKDDHEETVNCRKCDAPIDLQLNKNGTALTSIGNIRGGVAMSAPRLPAYHSTSRRYFR